MKRDANKSWFVSKIISKLFGGGSEKENVGCCEHGSCREEPVELRKKIDGDSVRKAIASDGDLLPFRPADLDGVSDRTELSFTHEEAVKACMEYFDGDELAAQVFVDKYSTRGADGTVTELTPREMHERLAKEFARNENTYSIPEDRSSHSEYGKTREALTYENIFAMLDRFRLVVPQGSVMSILGNRGKIGSLSNCIVLPELVDSYGGILFADQQLVQLMKRRCGVGLDITTLRPANMPVTNAAGSSTGPVSFMERFSNSTREVAQRGRRGALMITIDVSHPDVEDFVLIKQDLTKVTGANISVKLSDEFMRAVCEDSEYTHRWPAEGEPVVTKTIRARDLWDKIIAAAHNSAEPGLIFWDRQHWYSTSSVYPNHRNISTNPCSEIGMDDDSCRLIAMNMFSSVVDPFTPHARFDHDAWYKAVYEGQRLMDGLVDLELEQVEKIIAKIESDDEPDYIKSVELRTWKNLYKKGMEGRRTGLGFTALGDTLAALGLKFDSNEALSVVEDIMRTKFRGEMDSSIDMAIERGAFVGFDPEIEKTSHFVKMMEKEFPDVYERMMRHGRRNISLSTVAPTGSLSILTQTSSGIEPVYMLSYRRRKKVVPGDNSRVDFIDNLGDAWQEFTVYHPKLKMWMEVTGETDISKSPYAGSTAPEIDWEKRVRLQAVVQKYVTHSISSTINLPSDVSVDKVGEIYMRSWELGLKGITVYRDGSRTGVLVSTEDKKDKKDAYTSGKVAKRPKTLHCEVHRFVNRAEQWIGFVGLLDGQPYEIFTGKASEINLPKYAEVGKIRKTKTKDGSKYDFIYTAQDGSEAQVEWLNRAFEPHCWNYAKMISGVMRHGMPLEYVIDLIGSLNFEEKSITSWQNGVARMLKKYVPDGTVVKEKCTECGASTLVFQEGCLICQSCGSSKCS